MQTFLHKKFNLNIKEHIRHKDKLLITVSSGQDSLCLLKLINDHFKGKTNNLQAIYIDHQWKRDSIKHAQHIGNIIQTFKIPLNIYQIKNLNLSENEARKARYKIFVYHAIKHKCTNIITGHNQNDQMETFLHNLFRGSSLNGITNFMIQKNIGHQLLITRPLINCTKAEIAWFCRSFCLPIWSDLTNYNYYIRRNRLRYELVPYLKNYFNPKIEQALVNFMQLCQNDNEYLRENSLKLYLISSHSKLISLNLKILKKQHYALQKRVIQLHFHYHFRQQLSEKIIQLILSLNYKKNAESFFSIKNLVVQNYDEWLYIYHLN